VSWRPTAELGVLRRRAATVAKIREYFARTGALEVDTPLLCAHGVTDPALENFAVPCGEAGTAYLQTSPEFAMKRLLAAGSGDIWQLCHAFRREEAGRIHNPEFTMLEWYRVGSDHHALMDDVADLLEAVGFSRPQRRTSYAALCLEHTGLDPHRATTGELVNLTARWNVVLGPEDLADRALLLDLVFSHAVLPALESAGAVFVYDFPREHAAYARISAGSPPVGERFELIVDGMEIANGYHEIGDAAEQRARQEAENECRRRRGLAPMALDEALLAALAHGLPPCAGVALGLERLLLVIEGRRELASVMSFYGAARS
jgi:lysyl-tRNA synthetase class 2